MTSGSTVATRPKISRRCLCVEGAGEVGHRRDDEELPSLAEIRRQGRQAREILPSAMLNEKGCRPRADGRRRRSPASLFQRADVAQLDPASHCGVGPGEIRRRRAHGPVVEHVAQTCRTDPVLGDIGRQPSRVMSAAHHARTPSPDERRATVKPIRPSTAKTSGSETISAPFSARLFVPEPLPRVVARRLLGTFRFRSRQESRNV